MSSHFLWKDFVPRIPQQAKLSRVKSKWRRFLTCKFSKSLYLLCTLPEQAPWGSSTAKWGWEAEKKKKQNPENNGPHPGCVTPKWHLSNRMSHARVTVFQQTHFRWECIIQAPWEEYAFYAIDGVIEKLACLRRWRTYIL